MAEMKLTPREYRALFTTATKRVEETHVLFCARLKNLFSYYMKLRLTMGIIRITYLLTYMKSKSVDTMEKLVDLVIADTLNPGCLKYCLMVEGNFCAPSHELATAVNIYDSNYGADGHYRGSTVVTDSKNFHSMPSIQSNQARNQVTRPKASEWQSNAYTNRGNNLGNSYSGKPPTTIVDKPVQRAC